MKHRVSHALTHVVAHIVIPWVLRIVLVALAPLVGMVGLNIGPVAHALHVDTDPAEHVAKSACEWLHL